MERENGDENMGNGRPDPVPVPVPACAWKIERRTQRSDMDHAETVGNFYTSFSRNFNGTCKPLICRINFPFF